MARHKSFYDKVVQKVKRDVGYVWTRDFVSIMKGFGTFNWKESPETTRLVIERTRCRFFEREYNQPIVGDKLFRSIQREGAARRLDDEHHLNRGEPLPDPPIFPGLMVAWDTYPTTVQIDSDLIEHALATEANFACIRTNDLRALFPSCLLIDVRNRDVVLYDERVDALFVYPSYDADCGYDLLLIVGITLRDGLFEPLCSKLVLQRELLGEAIDHTISERERLRKRCLSETDRGLHDEIFSPAEDEEKIMLLATETLGLMLWEGTSIDRHASGRATHLHVRRRGKGEPSFQVQNVAYKKETEEGDCGARAEGRTSVDGHAGNRGGSESHAEDGNPSKSELELETSSSPKPTTTLPVDAATELELEDDSLIEAATKPNLEALSEPKLTAESTVETEPEPEPTPKLAPAPSPQSHIETEWEHELLDEIERLTTKTSEQEAKISSLTYHLRQLADTLEQERNAASSERARAEILETMDLPESPAEALLLAEHAFADRLIIMECAHKSAREFVRGDTAEVWAVLRSMAMVLHPMIFGRGGDNVVYAFRKQTGFELTLREMKMIKQVERLSRLRTVTYRGVEHSAAAHVKGRGRARGETLRVHFFADYSDQRLVITHCGEHLTTFDTAQL